MLIGKGRGKVGLLGEVNDFLERSMSPEKNSWEVVRVCDIFLGVVPISTLFPYDKSQFCLLNEIPREGIYATEFLWEDVSSDRKGSSEKASPSICSFLSAYSSKESICQSDILERYVLNFYSHSVV